MLIEEREVRQTDLICAMLDMFDVVHVGMHDEKYPYVVPMNFGYEMDEERLIIYLHCAKMGYKRKLLDANPHVCCTFSAFQNFPKKMYRGHRHDFRSVMAFGKVEWIRPEEDMKAYARGVKRLLQHYDRIPKAGEHRGFNSCDADQFPNIDLMRVVCAREDVFGKAEAPIRKVEDVPFKPVYDLPQNDEPYDLSDMIDRPKKASRFDL